MRKLAIFTGAFSGGIFLCQYLLPDSFLLPGALFCFALACVSLFLPWTWHRRCVLLFAALALALGYDWLYLRQVQYPMEALADTERQVSLTLCDFPVPTAFGAKVTAEAEGLPGKVVYYGGVELLDCSPGQTVTDLVRFQNAARIRDDDVTVFTSKGVFLLAYRRGEAVYGEGSAGAIRWWPDRLGRAMRTQMESLFSGDTAGFLIAILTGDKSGLSEGAALDLSEAGLFHILAVSGMHCGFLLTLVTLLVGRHRRRLLAAVAIPLLAFYALLTGGSPSVVRACLMLAFLLAAPLFHRDSDPPTALTAALFLILLQNPFAAKSISLQLSFAAVAGLLWLTPRLNRLARGKSRGFRIIWTSFSATMGALVFTAPLAGLYFGLLCLISPISNLLCLWAAGAVFMTGFPAVLVSVWCPPLAKLLALVPEALTGYILRVAHMLAKVPYHALYFTNPYLKYWLLLAYLLFFLAWVTKPRIGRKYLLAASLAAISLLVTVRAGVLRYTSGDLDAVMLDVGQGESIVLHAGEAFTLVDCGGSGWCDAGSAAADQLATMGCRSLDRLVLTHCDSDHVSGVTALLARMNVLEVLLPDDPDGMENWGAICSAAREAGAEITCIREKTTLEFGSGTLTVYPPLGDNADNEKGLTVLASCGEMDFLITGDMNSATERRLLETWELPDIEALAVGHHGAKTSTSAALLEALKPETALISVGPNSYGHPADETLRRLTAADCTICRTDLQGSIHLTLN